MDWTDLANRLAEGAKVYKAFQDGADVASQLAGLERANAELSAQYKVLEAQVEQAKAAVKAVQDDTARARIQANQDIARKWAESDAAHTTQMEAAQDELDRWKAKVSLQSANFATEAASWKDRIEGLTTQASQLDAQIQSLIRVRDSLKAQLQSVV